MRSRAGEFRQEYAVIVGLAAIVYYGYQYFSIYQAPSSLVNKDFICGDGAFSSRNRVRSWTVYGCQNPKLLVEYVRKSNLKARLSAPDQAVQNEKDRNQILQSNQLVNLAMDYDQNYLISSGYNPLVVHVLDTDNSAKDVPLLVVRPVNKSHKGETWYIAATSINPAANVTGFANVAAKTHKYGLGDVLDNPVVHQAIRHAVSK